jgi:hypothetical protein
MQEALQMPFVHEKFAYILKKSTFETSKITLKGIIEKY